MATPSRPRISTAAFEFGSMLGVGAFARVQHVRVAASSDGPALAAGEYALKMIPKRQILSKNRRSSVARERNLLASFDHPSIVRLLATFQDEHRVYFVLEYIAGGDVRSFIDRVGRAPLEFTRFFAGELVAVLMYLRRKQVAHRDIKCENVLLTQHDGGHIKLCDFDAACQCDASGYPLTEGDERALPHFVGTATYVPPETLLDASQEPGVGADLWALGCFVLECYAGLPPFKGATEFQTFERILLRSYEYPDDSPADLKSFCESLLRPAVEERVGFARARDLSQHPFLRIYPDVAALYTMEAPTLSKRRCSQAARGASFEETEDFTPQVGETFTNVAASEVLSRQSSPRLFAQFSSAQSPPSKTPLLREAPISALDCTARDFAHLKDTPRSRCLRALRLFAACLCCRRRRRWHPALEAPMGALCAQLRTSSILDSEERVTMLAQLGRMLICFRPRLLVLTDEPRLLIVDYSGDEPTLVREFGFELDAGLESTPREGGADSPRSVSAPVDSVAYAEETDEQSFVIVLSSGQRIRCVDPRGSQRWIIRVGTTMAALSSAVRSRMQAG